MTRGFGEVFAAVDKRSKEMYAIKKLKLVKNAMVIENEMKTLKKCHSKYIVRYYGALHKDNEEWVRFSFLFHL